MRFEVERATWKNGGTFLGQPSYLQNRQGNQCCLGFVCSQLDPVARTQLVSYPHQSRSAIVDLFFKSMQSDHDSVCGTRFVADAVSINDDDTIDNKTREFLLTGLFAEQGHELVFVGEYVD